MESKLKLILAASIAIIFFAGCGTSKGTPSHENKSYLVSPLDGAQKIHLDFDQNIIAGGSCAAASIYNANGDSFEDDIMLPSGDYTVVFREAYTRFSNSKGILYYQSAKISLKHLPLNKSIIVPNRGAVLFQLKIDTRKKFITNEDGTSVVIYDSNLEKIDISTTESFELNGGTYYIEGRPFYCTHGGSFIFAEL